MNSFTNKVPSPASVVKGDRIDVADDEDHVGHGVVVVLAVADLPAEQVGGGGRDGEANAGLLGG